MTKRNGEWYDEYDPIVEEPIAAQEARDKARERDLFYENLIKQQSNEGEQR